MTRSTLSRFLAALTEEAVEALRTLFLDDLLVRPLTHDKQPGGLMDRAGNTWMVFDIDGTREAARQRALPQTDELPPPFRRLDEVCAPASGYSPPTTATSFKTARFTGANFPLQPDGTLRCPAGQSLLAHERRREADGSLRVVYAASIRSCRPCPLREQCQWNGGATAKPRQVSVLLHPLVVGDEPLLWRDWSRKN